MAEMRVAGEKDRHVAPDDRAAGMSLREKARPLSVAVKTLPAGRRTAVSVA